MTHKTTMPEPVAWMLGYQTMGGGIGWKVSWTQSGAGVCHRLSGEEYEKPLITTDQAKAYADARVREALEAAEDAVTTLYEADDGPFLVEIARAICALIPQENKT